MQTIAEAKEFLRKNWEDGCECPACGQHVQLYDYKLFATSAFALLRLNKLTRDRPSEIYFHISEYAEAQEGYPRAPHFAELRFWGLVAKTENTDPTKKSSGFWCITDKGKRFCSGTISVPDRILVFNNKFCGFSEKSQPIVIQEALGNKFDYRELMGDPEPVTPQQEALSW